jgi:hypothetical protein
MLLRDIESALVTFPLSTRRHFGWFNPREVMEQGSAKLKQEAHAICDMITGPTPRYQRLWIVMDPFSHRPSPPGGPPNYYARIADILLGTVQARGLRPVDLGDVHPEELGMQVVEREE